MQSAFLQNDVEDAMSSNLLKSLTHLFGSKFNGFHNRQWQMHCLMTVCARCLWATARAKGLAKVVY